MAPSHQTRQQISKKTAMTQIDFFSNAPNRIEYVARLLLKVQQRGQNAVVYGSAQTLSALSTALWRSEGFLAHEMMLDNNAPLNDVAPFILTACEHEHWPHHQVLINLSDAQPSFFAQFERLIEIVPDEPAPKQKARDRWQSYKHTGYTLKHHDIAAMRK